MSVQELKAAVAQLSPDDIRKFAQWFEEFQGDAWDRQIEADILAGKLDGLVNKIDEAPCLSIKTFDLGSKGPLPSRSEIAQEMFDRQ